MAHPEISFLTPLLVKVENASGWERGRTPVTPQHKQDRAAVNMG